MKRLIVALAAAFFIILSASHGMCAGRTVIGGYDTAMIAQSTLDILQEKGFVGDRDTKGLRALLEAEQVDPLLSNSTIIDFYDCAGRVLTERGLATSAEIAAVRDRAAKSGGVKIGGVNPVVLAASFLDLLVQKGIVSAPRAQTLLDAAKKSPSPTGS